jgi:hypothetical protein
MNMYTQFEAQIIEANTSKTTRSWEDTNRMMRDKLTCDGLSQAEVKGAIF